MTLLEAGGTVVTAGDLEEVTLLVVIVETAEEAHDGILVLAAGDLGEDVARLVRAHEIEVVQRLGQEVLAQGAHRLGVPVLQVRTGRDREVMRIGERVVIGTEHVDGVTLAGGDGLFEGILARAGGVVLIVRIRVAAELEVHRPVLVAALVDAVGVVRRQGEVARGGDLQFRRVGEVGAELLVPVLVLAEHQVTAVRDVVVAADHRRAVHPAAVRILEREGSQRVAGRIREGVLDAASARIVIAGTVEGRVVGKAHELVQFRVDLRAEVVLLEHVRIELDDTALVVIGAGKEVLDVLVAARDGDAVLLDRVTVVVQFVVPVRVAVVHPLLAAVAVFLHDPGTFGILRHVVHAGQEFGHVVLGVGRVVLAGVGRPELVHGVDGPVAAGLEVGRNRRLFPAEAAAVADRGLAALVAAGLGGDENHTVGGARAVDGGGGGVLDHGDAFHVIGVHPAHVGLHAVHEDERVGGVDGGDAADVQGTGGTRVTRRDGDVQARDRTLEHVREVVRGTVFQFLGVHRGDGAGEVHLLLDAVAHDHGFLEELIVLLEGNAHRLLSRRDDEGPGGIAQTGDFQCHLAGGDTEGEGSVGGGHVAGRRTGDHDGRTDQGLLPGVQDCSGHDPCLRPGGREGPEQQDEGGCNVSNPSHKRLVVSWFRIYIDR